MVRGFAMRFSAARTDMRLASITILAFSGLPRIGNEWIARFVLASMCLDFQGHMESLYQTV